jgi:hypothetical protein
MSRRAKIRTGFDTLPIFKASGCCSVFATGSQTAALRFIRRAVTVAALGTIKTYSCEHLIGSASASAQGMY